MRYVSSILSAYAGFGIREMKDMVDMRAVTPVQPREPVVQAAVPHRQHEHQLQYERREAQQEERRRACRRVSYQPVLIELRSGVERRRHNLREGDIVEHIDEKV